MPDFQPFLMERIMSKHEKDVEYNLSESGVHPVLLSELLGDDPGHIRHLLETDLNYPHANGIPELRENIAALYNGAKADNVLVTVGAAEANYNSVRTLLSEGDEIVIMLPNYMQIWGVAKNHGFKIKTFCLREDKGWAPDLDELNDAITTDTKLITICNPNNPTGRILTEAEMEAIVAAADRAGAWILADEVYSGAERLTDEQCPSFYGRYDRVLAVGSLSKAYGLPGLRIGWVAGPVDMIDDIWARHEYTTISATILANKLAAIALSSEVRPRLIQRARDYIRKGYLVLEKWMDEHGSTLSLTAPQASAIAFVRYHLDINSTALVERLCREKSVMIIPGDHFGMDHLVRISFGLPHDYLVPALDRIHELIDELKNS
ncbi:MAG: aminotransferase class I/II-fold pyridoxal phosphate-dependent enzyme [Candidatus Latescibacteria bacterium]|nr:aminotransferase class I/II-fold pyridoxal phosphate-dependent enzyme [Candidatus Latescibacterota bacterium]NIO56294.1 aminotransferase class I/II-fold pyridoxal phosphate-dependent enzyme [Candidatus Latescibacterota bacterium]